jgi:hypothetical protein
VGSAFSEDRTAILPPSTTFLNPFLEGSRPSP